MLQLAGVQYVLDTVIYALLANPDRKFSYAEMVSSSSFLLPVSADHGATIGSSNLGGDAVLLHTLVVRANRRTPGDCQGAREEGPAGVHERWLGSA